MEKVMHTNKRRKEIYLLKMHKVEIKLVEFGQEKLTLLTIFILILQHTGYKCFKNYMIKLNFLVFGLI